jgi:eukaryotic-like serine/threonine-protein kinase
MSEAASSSVTEAEDLIGRLIDGRYKVLEAMASGSMGAVFKAERVPVGKLVAVKFLHAAFAGESEFLTRFERETRVMSKLAHPNCVSVVDFGVFDGAPYLVMDYVPGITLRATVDQGPLEPARALGIARQIASGLAHAHAQGVVHRDIKPANVMISEEIGTGEHVRLLDFGLARLRGAVGRDATQSNVVVGTPNYMAPEQTVGGGIIDARTDVYAVGVVLFEMVAGERPFQAEDTLALLGMHRAAPIPKLVDRPKLRGVTLPDGLQHVIEKAMAKSPDDRFQSAIELADAIDHVIDGRVIAGDLPARSGHHRKRNTAAIAATLELSVDNSAIQLESDDDAPPKKRSSLTTALVAILVLGGGGAAAAWYVTKGNSAPASEPTRDASAVTAEPAPPPPAPVPVEPAPPAAVPDAAVVVAVDPADAALAGIEPDAGMPATVDPDAGAPGAATADGGEIEMAPDPQAAENVAPKTPPASDEAPDAPKSATEVEKHVPAAPVLATTIPDAVQLIKEGKADLALSSLRALWKRNSNSAYIPFLLGNLYFDKQWWSVAMDHYRSAISKNAEYKKNQTLNMNIIRMLGSSKTSGKAEYFLRKTIGKPSVIYLKYAASHHESAYVRRYAATLARQI